MNSTINVNIPLFIPYMFDNNQQTIGAWKAKKVTEVQKAKGMYQKSIELSSSKKKAMLHSVM